MTLVKKYHDDENSCPSYLTKLLTKNSDRHNYNLVCPSYNREAEGGRSFQVSGAKLWNSIPLDIRKKESICAFKYSDRKYLLSRNT